MSWSITLPIYEPEVFDNSVLETHQRCPRKGLYRYGLRRAPIGTNYPIQFGVAYHKYREVVEDIMRERSVPMDRDVHADGVMAALEGWEPPPPDHKHSFLTERRLLDSLDLARRRIQFEQQQGNISVVRTEDAFDLALPKKQCPSCYASYPPDWKECTKCGSDLVDERYGGRMDQIVDWRGKLWVRDFKTTSRMGKTYPRQFDPNNQMTGYVWAGQGLSGRAVEGVIIETLYNTKRQGPDIKQFLSARSPGQIDQWLATTHKDVSLIRSYYDDAETEGYLAFPQHTLACDDFGGCFFRDACSKDNGPAIERWLSSQTQYSHWDFTNPEGEEQSAD